MTIRSVCDFMNVLLACDKPAVSKLVQKRVPTKYLGAHPTVPVLNTLKGDRVGLLGILNGLFPGDEALGVRINDLGDVAEFIIVPLSGPSEKNK